MIYYLVRRDASLKPTLYLAAACPLAALIGLWRPPGTNGFLLFWILILAFFTVVTTRQRCTLLEAALPIRARDLLFARLASAFISIWLPICAALLTALTRGNIPWTVFTAVINCGVLMTLAVTLVHSAAIDRFEPPKWWATLVGLATVIAASFVLDLQIPIQTIAGPLSLVIGVLVWRSLKTIPESFQIVDNRLPRTRRRQFGTAIPLPWWMPIVRQLYPLRSLGLLLLIGIFEVTGSGRSTTMFAGMIYLIIFWQQQLRGVNWLFELPISRSRLFLLVGTLPFGFYELANLYGFHIFHRPARDTIVMLLVSTTVSLSLMLALELSHISSLRGISTKSFGLLAFGFWLIVIVGTFLSAAFGEYIGTLGLFDRVSTILPSNIISLCILTMGIFTFLYTLAHWVFCRLEVIPKPASAST